MSKTKIDRRESSFKARDNVETLMHEVIHLVEKEFTRCIEAQSKDVGNWSADGNTATINLEIATPFRNIEDKIIILRCGSDGGVEITYADTWLLQTFRQKIVDATFDLMSHVNTANGIHPITISEFDERRLNQDKSITDCYHITHILQQAIYFIHLKPSKVEHIIELIDEEIRLLRGWRRSEYKKRDIILKRENG